MGHIKSLVVTEEYNSRGLKILNARLLLGKWCVLALDTQVMISDKSTQQKHKPVQAQRRCSIQ